MNSKEFPFYRRAQRRLDLGIHQSWACRLREIGKIPSPQFLTMDDHDRAPYLTLELSVDFKG